MVPKKAAMMRVIQAVHLQPRYDCVMKPLFGGQQVSRDIEEVVAYPMIGPAIGPMNVAAAKTQTAMPLSTGPKKSARAPPTIARGADAKAPPKNRHSIIVYKFCATATGIWKMAKQK
jgi:hypothetical protein